MPAQQKKSGLLAKLGDNLRKAHEAHTNDEIPASNTNLPGGIENGVAQLSSVKIGEFENGDNKGKPFFMAAGVVFVPDTIDGIPIKGLQTRIGPEPLCDTPKNQSRKTLDDHVKWVYDELHKLGVDTNDFDPNDLEESLNAALEALVDRQPFFRFTTWKPPVATEGKYKGQDTRVVHKWHGEIDYTPEEGLTPVDDDSAAAETNGHVEEAPKAKAAPTRTTAKAPPAKAPAKPAGKVPSKKQPEPEPEEESPEEGSGFDEFSDLDSLATAADDGDEDAKQKLQQMANDVGIATSKVLKADSWAQVVEMIQEAGGSASEEEAPEEEAQEEEEAEEYPVSVGEVYKYHPLVKDAKSGKMVRSAKGVQVEVLTRNTDAKTVTLKNLTNDKTIMGADGKKPLAVKWDDLKPAD